MAKDFQLSPPPRSGSLSIPIFQKTYDFYKELYQALVDFPKAHKYTLGHRLETTTLELFELLAIAGKRPSDKTPFLEKADAKLDTLKLLIRLAKDTKSLSSQKYVSLEALLQEIGKMLGGWLRHTKQIT